MKILLLTLLLLLLCSTQVFTLRCYVCSGNEDDICKNVEECAPSALYCKTSEHDGKISRSCEDFCAENVFTACCQEDLC